MKKFMIYKYIKQFPFDLVNSFMATLIVTYILSSEKRENILDIKPFISLILNYTFLVYWVIAIIVLSIVRALIVRKIDKMQTPYPMIAGFKSHNDMRLEITSQGFKWRGLADIERKDSRTQEVLEINIDTINGPYCIKDYRKMKEHRNYLGIYKYKCPKCRYTQRKFKNTWSLKCEVSDEIEADYRQKAASKSK